MTLYTIYLTWSAVANNPGMVVHYIKFILYVYINVVEKECNPGMLGIINNSTTDHASSKVTFDTTNIIGLIVWLLCVLYNCVSSAVEVSRVNRTDSEKRGECMPESSTTFFLNIFISFFIYNLSVVCFFFWLVAVLTLNSGHEF